MNDTSKGIPAELLSRIEKKTVLDWFDSPAEFAEAADKKVTDSSHKFGGGDWYGHDDWATTIANVTKGWPKIVDKAESLMDELEREGLLSMGWKGYQPNVAGAFPLVPAAIIGAPESMFDRAENKAENSAIRVFVDIAVSCIVTQKAIIARGTAIAAFVLGLSARRPVELYVFAGLDSGYSVGFSAAVVRIDTRPMDLSALSYCLSSPSYYRRLCMGWARLTGYQGGWAYGLYPGNPMREVAMRHALQLEKQDVLIPAEISEGAIVHDPVGWVRDMLTEHIIENVNVD
jgi:hypothetical protein